MFTLLAFRNLTTRPWRTLLLLGGFGIGVGVMIVLLSIGEAMLVQARDEKLVGGGEITVLPEGLDVEVMKTGGVGGLFFSIANARFVHLQLLAAPRLSGAVRAVAPQIDGKLLYLRTADRRELPVRATGEIPSATVAVGAGPTVLAGRWEDDDADRRWLAPTPAELRHSIDHFHETPPDVADRETWAEWHYFNVISADRRRWTFVTFAIGGDVPRGEWGGQLLVTTHGDGAPDRRYALDVPKERVRYSSDSADLVLGDAFVDLLPDGRYHVVGRAPAVDGGGGEVRLDLTVTPSGRAYFPGVDLGGGAVVSGYAVPALRADASGEICRDGACERLDGVQGYHDHNWGIWRRVDWEWGAGRAGELAFLYGRVQPNEEVAESPPLLFYVVDSLGFLALFRPTEVAYDDGGTVVVDGRTIAVPSRFVLADARGGDTLRLEVTVEHATGTDTRRGLQQRGDSLAARALPRPYFIQMKGLARVSGRVGGRVVQGSGTGFFETYR